jgi:hypothetical protein
VLFATSAAVVGGPVGVTVPPDAAAVLRRVGDHSP